MSNPTIPRTHYDRLDQRRLWLTNRIEAKEKTGWETTYDESERDALAAALAVLEPVEDPGHPPIPEGWEKSPDHWVPRGCKYCFPGDSEWKDWTGNDSVNPNGQAIVIRKIKDTAPDPGEGHRLLKVGELIEDGDEIFYEGSGWSKSYLTGDKVEDAFFRRKVATEQSSTPDPGEGHRRAEGEDWKDERCEWWNGSEWTLRAPGNRSMPFLNRFAFYRVPIDPAPKHPPVPDGWRKLSPGELVEEGDRCFYPRQGEWVPTFNWTEMNGGKQSSGLAYIRRIEPTCRPFASAEEFDPHAGRIVVNIGTGTRRRIDHWSDKGCMGMSWDMVHRKFRFLDDGSPFGVEVKP